LTTATSSRYVRVETGSARQMNKPVIRPPFSKPALFAHILPQSAWEPQFASEGEANIETKRGNNKGTITAVGVLALDTSNRIVKQIFDVDKSTVLNEVELDFGIGRAGGTFRQSPNVPSRVIVSLNEASIAFKNGFVVPLGWVFPIIYAFRKSKDMAWLETTFLDSEMRIGRGNKGTMFILTRDRSAVQS
jgi:PAP_fibrillin